MSYGILCDGNLLTIALVGSEIYVGFSNGELIRFALQADDPAKVRTLSIHLPKTEKILSVRVVHDLVKTDDSK